MSDHAPFSFIQPTRLRNQERSPTQWKNGNNPIFNSKRASDSLIKIHSMFHVTTSSRTHLETETQPQSFCSFTVPLRNNGLNILASTRFLRTLPENEDVNVLRTWECVCACVCALMLFCGGASPCRRSAAKHREACTRKCREERMRVLFWGRINEGWNRKGSDVKKPTYSDKICWPKSRHWARRSEEASASVPTHSRSSTRETHGVRLESRPLPETRVYLPFVPPRPPNQWLCG